MFPEETCMDRGTELKRAAEAIVRARVVIGFTGAGVSTESGIPDFRTLGSFWEGFDPATFEKEIDSREAFERHPEKVWGFFRQAIQGMEQARPNPGHRAMARLGDLGKMAAVVTQNVDGLHQDAGSENVIEFHGNLRRILCVECGAQYPWAEIPKHETSPRCSCGGLLKPEVPLFGDEVNPEAFSTAHVLALNAQVLLLAGTHGDIAPVNRIPVTAKENGALIVEVNRERSLYTDRVTDLFLEGSAGEILTDLVREVEAFLALGTGLDS
jgi:NAD-dependent deacetylase